MTAYPISMRCMILLLLLALVAKVVGEECSQKTKTEWVIEVESDATALTDAVTCTGGLFIVKWQGIVQLSRPVILGGGSVLTISGTRRSDGSYESQIIGDGSTRLFVLNNDSSLLLTDLQISNGSTSQGWTTSFYSSSIEVLTNTPSVESLLAADASYYSTSAYYYGGDAAAAAGGGAIYAGFFCTLEITSCTISDNFASSGGAIFVRYGTSTTINSTNFIGNEAYLDGGAIFASGTLTLDDCTFEGNMGKQGAALGLSASVSVTMSNCTFESNRAGSIGGAAWGIGFNNGTEGPNVDVTSCVFRHNSAAVAGGVFNLINARLNINDCFFEENSAVSGGVLSIDTCQVVSAATSQFNGNTATLKGGVVVQAGDSNLNFESCNFTGNTAGIEGGAISTLSAVSVTLTSCIFSANAAALAGAIVSTLNSVSIVNTVFEDNAATSGSALFFLESDNSVIQDCTFEDSTTRTSSAFILLEGCAAVSMWNTTFSHNFSASTSLSSTGGSSGDHFSAMDIRRGSSVNASTLQFSEFSGSTVMYIEDSWLVLQDSSFRDCPASKLIDRERGAVIARNTQIGDATYKGIDYDRDVTLIDAISCDTASNDPCGGNQGSKYCYDDDQGGVYCLCYEDIGLKQQGVGGDDVICMKAADSSVSTMGITVGSDGIHSPSFYDMTNYSVSLESLGPELLLSTFVMLSATWQDSSYVMVWQADMAAAEGLVWSITPSAGLLAGNSSITLKISAVQSASVSTALNALSTSILTISGNPSSSPENPNDDTTSTLVTQATVVVRVQHYYCPAEYYWDNYGNESSCEACAMLEGEASNGVDCSEPGSTLESLYILKGYWRSSPTSVDIKKCFKSSACAGADRTDAAEYCSAGYEGPYCSVCANGYSANSFTGECFSCSSSSTEVGTLVVASILCVLCVLALLLLVKYLTKVINVSGDKAQKRSSRPRRIAECIVLLAASDVGTRMLSAIKSIIIVLQIVVQYTQICRIELTGPLAALLNTFAFLTLDLSWAVSSLCLYNINFYDKFLISTLIPIGVALILLVTYGVGYVRNNLGGSVEQAVYPRFSAYESSSALVADKEDEGSPDDATSAVVVAATMAPGVKTPRNSNRSVHEDVGSVKAMVKSVLLRKHMLAMNTVLFILYAGISSYIFLMLAPCESIDGIDYLAADYSIECSGSTYMRMRIFASCMVLLYPIGIPVMFFYALWSYRSILSLKEKPSLLPSSSLSCRAIGDLSRQDADCRKTRPAIAAPYAGSPLRSREEGEEQKARYDSDTVPETPQEEGGSGAVPEHPEDQECMEGTTARCDINRSNMTRSGQAELTISKDWRRKEPNVQHLAILWRNYKAEVWYFEVVECLRRLALTSILAFIFPNSPGQQMMACVLAFFFAVLFEYLSPMDVEEATSYRCGAVIVFLVALLGLSTKIDTTDSTTFDAKYFQGVIFALFVLLFAMFFFMATYDLCLTWKVMQRVRHRSLRNNMSRIKSVVMFESHKPE